MKLSKVTRLICTFLALTIIIAVGAGAINVKTQQYSDVSASDWHYDFVEYCTQTGLMSGTGDAKFSPDLGATRAMAVTTLYRLEGTPEMGNGKSGTFIDVPEYVWYTDAVEWAAAWGIVTGYNDNTFGPNDIVSREQLAAMLHRYADYKGYDVSVSDDASLPDFADASDISEYAALPMQWAVENNILSGRTDNTLSPLQNASRAELATVLTRFSAEFIVLAS